MMRIETMNLQLGPLDEQHLGEFQVNLGPILMWLNSNRPKQGFGFDLTELCSEGHPITTSAPFKKVVFEDTRLHSFKDKGHHHMFFAYARFQYGDGSSTDMRWMMFVVDIMSCRARVWIGMNN